MKPHKLVMGAMCFLLTHSIYAQDQPASISVHFEFDKSDINAADMSSLQNFKSTHPDIESIIIDGYADTTGTNDYNYRLSQRRCNAVKQALGYDEKKTEVLMKVTAHGEKDLLFTTDPENRVAIVAVNEKKQPVAEKEPEPKKEEPVAQQPPPPPPPPPPAETKPEPVKDTVPSAPKEVGKDESGLLKQLQDSKVGESVVLTEIHFEEGRHVLLKSSRPALNAMLDALKKIPTLQLEIQGHMCCGDMLAADGFDMDTKEFMLSYNRAKEVNDFMVQNGIDASRLTYKGFGTRKRLVYPEMSDDDRAKNRRVEFVVTKK